jgi:ATP-dependent Clp protease ATP-binding subunit ClpC
VGYEEGGQLTERVRRQPYSVVLLDEIEKANSEVYNLLLQVFDDGRLTDGKGRVIDFTHTIIIATSNLGQDYIRNSVDDEGRVADRDRLSEQLSQTIREHFPAEFINRLDDTVIFHPLTRDEIARIVMLQLEVLRRNAHSQGISLSIDQSLVSFIAQVGYHPLYGARELQRKIRSEIETKLAAAMLRNEVKSGDTAFMFYSIESKQVQVSNPASGGPGDHKLSA